MSACSAVVHEKNRPCTGPSRPKQILHGPGGTEGGRPRTPNGVRHRGPCSSEAWRTQLAIELCFWQIAGPRRDRILMLAGKALLVDDRVDQRARLRSGRSPMIQLALAAAIGNMASTALECGLHRLADALAVADDRPGRTQLDRGGWPSAWIGPLPSDRDAERIADPGRWGARSNGHLEDAPGGLETAAPR